MLQLLLCNYYQRHAVEYIIVITVFVIVTLGTPLQSHSIHLQHLFCLQQSLVLKSNKLRYTWGGNCGGRSMKH